MATAADPFVVRYPMLTFTAVVLVTAAAGYLVEYAAGPRTAATVVMAGLWVGAALLLGALIERSR